MTDPTYYPLKLLKICGLHPHSKSKFLSVYFCVNYSLFICILTLASIGVATTYDNNIFKAMENLQTVFLYIHVIALLSIERYFGNIRQLQMLGKYYNLYWKKNQLAELLKLRENFWNLERFPSSIRDECEATLEKTSKFVRNFIIVTTLVILNFFVQPILTGDLPVSVYCPEGWFHYINLTYWYLLPVIVGNIYGSDVIFWSICVPVTVQFKLLRSKLQNWDFDNFDENHMDSFKKELKKVIDHQNFLLQYCNKINNYAKSVFLNQILVSTAIICMQLFVVSQKEFLLPNKIKCLGYCMMEIMETAIFCFNAELITDSAEKIGYAAYNTFWYQSKSVDIQKSIVLLIQRSQKQIVFSGCGLVLVNLKTFTQIFKTAMSFLSYLNTMVAYN